MANFDLNDSSACRASSAPRRRRNAGQRAGAEGASRSCVLEAGGRHEIPDFINNDGTASRSSPGPTMRTTSGSWRVARDFPNLPAWIVKAVAGRRRTGPALRCASRSTSSRCAATYGGINRRRPARLADRRWPRWRRGTPRPSSRWALPAPTESLACRATTTIKVLACRGDESSATRRCTPATCRSTASRGTSVVAASRSASASRGCKSGAKWSTRTPRSPRARPPATWRCGQARWRSRLSTMPRVR